MAELPDLSVFAETLTRRFGGKVLQSIAVKVTKKLNVDEKVLRAELERKKLDNVTREGKTLQFHFSKGNVLGLHLMLRGELMLLEKGDPIPKYEIVSFNFANGEGFAVVDILKQATLTLNPEPAKAPDALDLEIDYFLDLLSKKKKLVKEVLMDQKLLRGIGNSYADEILWHARISPFSISNAIPEKEVKKLFKSIRVVLERAIKEIAEENGDELRGELRDFMKVHGSKIEKSPTGFNVKVEKIGGRSSYYTEEQELYT